MANSIIDGIIRYNSVKYKIIGETDTYYIGFTVKSLRSVLCRINKDLTGWKSKSIATVIDLVKAVVNPDGSIVAIGSKPSQEFLDYHCPGSCRTYNDAIICNYKSDLSIIDPEDGLYPFIVCDRNFEPTYSDVYFKDIVKFNNSFIIIGHAITNQTDCVNVRDMVCRYDGPKQVEIIPLLNHTDVNKADTYFKAKAVSHTILVNDQQVEVVSQLENITDSDKSYLHGIKLSVALVNDDTFLLSLVQVIFGTRLISLCYDTDSIFILGAYQETTKSSNGSVVIHGKIQNRLYKVNRKSLNVETLMLPEPYDKLSIKEDVLELEIAYADPETSNVLRLTKDLLLLTYP